MSLLSTACNKIFGSEFTNKYNVGYRAHMTDGKIIFPKSLPHQEKKLARFRASQFSPNTP
jgi:hypothetical protein